MNALNNQQINPGNRVDFSRIRRFAKGGIPKYQNTPGTLKYNWDPFYGQFSNNTAVGQSTQTSIPWNKTWSPDEQYATVKDLENSQHYKDFTNYVTSNSSDEQVMGYLKHLDSQARRSGNSEGLLFTDANQMTLKDGWNTEYERLRNDGKYGYFHLTPELAAEQETLETQPEQGQPTEEQPVEQQGTIGTPSQNYNTLDFLPQRKKSPLLDTGYLFGIYGNNVRSIDRQLKHQLDFKAPLQQANRMEARTDNAYLQRQQMKQELAEQRAQAQRIASSSSDLSQSMRYMQDFEQNVANPMQDRMAQIEADAVKQSEQNVLNASNYNNQESTRVANLNTQLLEEARQLRNNYKSAAEAKKASERASLINNLHHKKSEWLLNEKQNDIAYNRKVDSIMSQNALNQATEEYRRASDIAAGSAEQSSGISIQSMVDLMLTDNSGTFNLSEDEIAMLQDGSADKSDIVEILKQHQTALSESNPNVRVWFDTYNQGVKDADTKFLQAKDQISQRLAMLELGRDPYQNGTVSWSGVGTNWSQKYPSAMIMKKGGKTSDRWTKYLSYRTKVEDIKQKALAEEDKRAQEKLIRDLDALDRETLLLLRAIFK